MKRFLAACAILAFLPGAGLLVMPAAVASFLLGVPLAEAGGVFLGRMAGVVLIALAVACWMARSDTPSAVTMIKAMALYHVSATILFLYAATVGYFSGVGLWPAALLHVALLVGCFRNLQPVKSQR